MPTFQGQIVFQRIDVWLISEREQLLQMPFMLQASISLLNWTFCNRLNVRSTQNTCKTSSARESWMECSSCMEGQLGATLLGLAACIDTQTERAKVPPKP